MATTPISGNNGGQDTPTDGDESSDNAKFEVLVGLLERATNSKLESADWDANVECVTLISEITDQSIIAKFIKLLRNKLKHKDRIVVMLTLYLLESMVSNCDHSVLSVMNRDSFMGQMGELARSYFVSQKSSMKDRQVLRLCLNLLRSWSETLQEQNEIYPNMVNLYTILEVEGIYPYEIDQRALEESRRRKQQKKEMRAQAEAVKSRIVSERAEAAALVSAAAIAAAPLHPVERARGGAPLTRKQSSSINRSFIAGLARDCKFDEALRAQLRREAQRLNLDMEQFELEMDKYAREQEENNARKDRHVESDRATRQNNEYTGKNQEHLSKGNFRSPSPMLQSRATEDDYDEKEDLDDDAEELLRREKQRFRHNNDYAFKGYSDMEELPDPRQKARIRSDEDNSGNHASNYEEEEEDSDVSSITFDDRSLVPPKLQAQAPQPYYEVRLRQGNGFGGVAGMQYYQMMESARAGRISSPGRWREMTERTKSYSFSSQRERGNTSREKERERERDAVLSSSRDRGFSSRERAANGRERGFSSRERALSSREREREKAFDHVRENTRKEKEREQSRRDGGRGMPSRHFFPFGPSSPSNFAAPTSDVIKVGQDRLQAKANGSRSGSGSHSRDGGGRGVDPSSSERKDEDFAGLHLRGRVDEDPKPMSRQEQMRRGISKNQERLRTRSHSRGFGDFDTREESPARSRTHKRGEGQDGGRVPGSHSGQQLVKSGSGVAMDRNGAEMYVGNTDKDVGIDNKEAAERRRHNRREKAITDDAARDTDEVNLDENKKEEHGGLIRGESYSYGFKYDNPMDNPAYLKRTESSYNASTEVEPPEVKTAGLNELKNIKKIGDRPDQRILEGLAGRSRSVDNMRELTSAHEPVAQRSHVEDKVVRSTHDDTATRPIDLEEKKQGRSRDKVNKHMKKRISSDADGESEDELGDAHVIDDNDVFNEDPSKATAPVRSNHVRVPTPIFVESAFKDQRPDSLTYSTTERVQSIMRENHLSLRTADTAYTGITSYPDTNIERTETKTPLSHTSETQQIPAPPTSTLAAADAALEKRREGRRGGTPIIGSTFNSRSSEYAEDVYVSPVAAAKAKFERNQAEGTVERRASGTVEGGQNIGIAGTQGQSQVSAETTKETTPTVLRTVPPRSMYGRAASTTMIENDHLRSGHADHTTSIAGVLANEGSSPKILSVKDRIKSLERKSVTGSPANILERTPPSTKTGGPKSSEQKPSPHDDDVRLSERQAQHRDKTINGRRVEKIRTAHRRHNSYGSSWDLGDLVAAAEVKHMASTQLRSKQSKASVGKGISRSNVGNFSRQQLLKASFHHRNSMLTHGSSVGSCHYGISAEAMVAADPDLMSVVSLDRRAPLKYGRQFLLGMDDDEDDDEEEEEVVVTLNLNYDPFYCNGARERDPFLLGSNGLTPPSRDKNGSFSQGNETKNTMKLANSKRPTNPQGLVLVPLGSKVQRCANVVPADLLKSPASKYWFMNSSTSDINKTTPGIEQSKDYLRSLQQSVEMQQVQRVVLGDAYQLQPEVSAQKMSNAMRQSPPMGKKVQTARASLTVTTAADAVHQLHPSEVNRSPHQKKQSSQKSDFPADSGEPTLQPALEMLQAALNSKSMATSGEESNLLAALNLLRESLIASGVGSNAQSSNDVDGQKQEAVEVAARALLASLSPGAVETIRHSNVDIGSTSTTAAIIDVIARQSGGSLMLSNLVHSLASAGGEHGISLTPHTLSIGTPLASPEKAVVPDAVLKEQMYKPPSIDDDHNADYVQHNKSSDPKHRHTSKPSSRPSSAVDGKIKSPPQPVPVRLTSRDVDARNNEETTSRRHRDYRDGIVMKHQFDIETEEMDEAQRRSHKKRESTKSGGDASGDNHRRSERSRRERTEYDDDKAGGSERRERDSRRSSSQRRRRDDRDHYDRDRSREERRHSSRTRDLPPKYRSSRDERERDRGGRDRDYHDDDRYEQRNRERSFSRAADGRWRGSSYGDEYGEYMSGKVHDMSHLRSSRRAYSPRARDREGDRDSYSEEDEELRLRRKEYENRQHKKYGDNEIREDGRVRRETSRDVKLSAAALAAAAAASPHSRTRVHQGAEEHNSSFHNSSRSSSFNNSTGHHPQVSQHQKPMYNTNIFRAGSNEVNAGTANATKNNRDARVVNRAPSPRIPDYAENHHRRGSNHDVVSGHARVQKVGVDTGSAASNSFAGDEREGEWWDCAVCTLRNPPDFLTCDACGVIKNPRQA